MTQWADESDRGRARGPVALGRAWVEVLLRPRQFFARKVAPGDQAPGLTFAATVVFVAEATRLVTVTDGYPVVAGQPLASAVFWLLALVVLVVPAGIHLTAAVQTVILIGTVEQRAGVSETVQVICYSLAPIAFLGLPSVPAQAAAVVWSGCLFVFGMATVHDISLPKTVVASAVPAVVLLGYGFGGNADVLFVWERLTAYVAAATG